MEQAVLEETSLERRLRRVLELVREQTRVLSIASKIHSEVEGKLNSRHREYYLRQQLKAIRSELGEEVRDTPNAPRAGKGRGGAAVLCTIGSVKVTKSSPFILERGLVSRSSLVSPCGTLR